MISGLTAAAWILVGCQGGASEGEGPGPEEAGFVLHTCLDAIAHVSREDDLDRAKALALQGLEHAGTNPELRRLADTTLAYVILMRDGLAGLQVHLGAVEIEPTDSRGAGLMGGEGLEASKRSAGAWAIDGVRPSGAASGSRRAPGDPRAPSSGLSGSGDDDAPSACGSAGTPTPFDPGSPRSSYPIYVDL
jgi:hypothetical protein